MICTFIIACFYISAIIMGLMYSYFGVANGNNIFLVLKPSTTPQDLA